MTRRAVATTLVALTLGAGGWWGVRQASAAGDVAVGATAPDFRAASLVPGDTVSHTLADYRGDVVLLNLWATWCGPCVVEMPSIQRLYDRFRAQGLRVVGVAVDDPPFADRVRAFVAEHRLTFDILHEGSGAIEQAYRSRGLPATYIIGRDGRIRVIRQGASDWDSPAHRAVIAQLLGPAAGASADTGTPSP
jgi:peroxiredoxin